MPPPKTGAVTAHLSSSAPAAHGARASLQCRWVSVDGWVSVFGCRSSEEEEYVQWVLVVFGDEDETYLSEKDARSDLQRARELGRIAWLRKRTIAEETVP